MPNPSSKYDAQGQGGIINIKTKRNALAGFNGSLGGSAAGMYFKKPDVFEWNEDLWANLNYRGKKTNTFVNLYEGIYNMGMDFSTELELREPDFKQHTESFQNNSYRAFNVKLGNDWFINDKNILGVIATVPGSWNVMGGRKGEEYNGFTDQTLAGETARDLSSSLNNQKNLQGSANINYTHIFDPDRSAELTANLDWYRSRLPDCPLEDYTEHPRIPAIPVPGNRTNVLPANQRKVHRQRTVEERQLCRRFRRLFLLRQHD